MSALISLRHVAKSFGSKQVLKDVSLDVPRGKSVVIIGGSGSGKSVTLKCILGLLEPDGGEIRIDGQNTTHVRGAARAAVTDRIGMLFQAAALFDSLPVWENVAFSPLAGHRMTRPQARAHALKCLEEVGLDETVAEMTPAALSGGMKKRVGLARAIACEPDILFFDEPTTGLDPIMADMINALIVKCVKDLGASTLTITHDMDSARKIGDIIAMLYQGRLIWQGTIAELDHCTDPVVRQFVAGRTDGPIPLDPDR